MPSIFMSVIWNSVLGWVFISLLKQSQKSRSVLSDGSRYLRLFWKGKLMSYIQRNAVLSISFVEFESGIGL